MRLPVPAETVGAGVAGVGPGAGTNEEEEEGAVENENKEGTGWFGGAAHGKGEARESAQSGQLGGTQSEIARGHDRVQSLSAPILRTVGCGGGGSTFGTCTPTGNRVTMEARESPVFRKTGTVA